MSVEKDEDAFPPISVLLKLGHSVHEKLTNNEFEIESFRFPKNNPWWWYQKWGTNLFLNFLGRACLEFIEEDQPWLPIKFAEKIHDNLIQLPGLKCIGLIYPDFKDLMKRNLLMIRSVTSDQSETFVLGYYRFAPPIMLKGNVQSFYMEVLISEEDEAFLKGTLSFKIFQPCQSLFIQLRAIARIQHLPDLFDLFVNINPRLFHFADGKYFKLAPGSFNTEEKRIIRKVVTAVLQVPPPPHVRCALVQGPPGTGKTHMICGMIQTILNFSLPKGPILVCASSNCAVDNVAKKLLDSEDFLFKYTLARFGNTKRIDPRIARHTATYLDNCQDKTAVVSNTNVLLCTLGSLDELTYFKQFRKNPFQLIIFDEAEQTSIPEAAIISRFKFNFLVMIGDQCQLPPLIFANAIPPQSWPSILEMFMQKVDAKDVDGLIVQYRMLPVIMSFPSDRYYDGSLVASRNAGINAMIQEKKLRHYVLFKFEQGKDRRVRSGDLMCSVYNPGEAFFISNLAAEIMRAFPKKKPTFAVITFYEAQRVQIESELIGRYPDLAPFIDINTVDSIQGQERDIVVVSPVRVDQAGFTASEQRTNVALTRAKSSLFVCSHLNVVSVYEPWISLFRNAEHREMLSGEKLIYVFPNSSNVSIKEIHNSIFKL